MQHVHPGKARAHHDGVENRSNFGRAFRSGRGGSHGCVISWSVAALGSFSEGSRNKTEVHNDIRGKLSIRLAA
jgi:hypothetical protein